MRKYILSRIFRSLLSVVVVTALVYVIVYTLVPTSLIFKQDPNYNKMTKTLDKKVDYENTTFDSMGYIDYLSAGSCKSVLVAKAAILIVKLPTKIICQP